VGGILCRVLQKPWGRQHPPLPDGPRAPAGPSSRGFRRVKAGWVSGTIFDTTSSMQHEGVRCLPILLNACCEPDLSAVTTGRPPDCQSEGVMQ
jgi:hypothetical protein